MMKMFLLSTDHYQAVDGAAPVPITFRYTVEMQESKVTNVFKPKDSAPPPTDAEESRMKPGSLGAVYINNFHKVICNKRASLVWEACLCCHGSQFVG